LTETTLPFVAAFTLTYCKFRSRSSAVTASSLTNLETPADLNLSTRPSAASGAVSDPAYGRRPHARVRRSRTKASVYIAADAN
jgi:hypothetical protein